jgi:hypothetical protein
MVEASGSRSGSEGGDPNKEMVPKIIADTLQAQNFSGILPEGMASLIGVLSKAITQGMVVGHAKQLEKARKAAEDKATEKKR